MTDLKRTRGDSSESSNSETGKPQRKRKDFASGDGLQHGESSKSKTTEAPTVQQDTQDSAMESFLDKNTLASKLSSNYINGLRSSITNSKNDATVTGLMHITPHIKMLRDYAVYPNTTKEEAIIAYKAIEKAYKDDTYNNALKRRCEKLGFSFAQD